MEENNKLKESQEQNNQNKNQELIKTKFIKEFSKTFLAWKDRNKFIEEIMKNDSISDSELLKRKLKVFKASTNDEELKNFDESQINIYDLRAEVAKDYIDLNNTKDIYFEFLENNYDLSEKDLKKLKESTDFKRLTKKQIESLLKNEKKNIDFVSSILNKKIKSKYDIDIFDTLTDEEITKRLEKIWKNSPELAHKLKLALLRISQWQTNWEDFRFLFDSGILKLDEKKELLEKSVPYLTFSQAKKYWLLNDEELEEYKEKIFEYYIKKQDNLTDEQKEKLKEVFNIDNLKISSKKLFDSINNVSLDSLVLDYDFTGVSNSINEAFDDVKHEIEKDSNIDLLKKLGLDIEKLKKWSVLEIILPEKTDDWKKTDFEEHYFFEIKDLDDSSFILKDIWKNDNIHYTWDSKKVTFLEFVKGLKKEDWRIKFYTNKEFKEVISDESSEFDIDSSFEFKHSFENKDLAIKEILDNLLEKKEKLEKDLKDLEAWVWEYSWINEDEKNKIKKELNNKIEKLDLNITWIKENNFSNEELLWEYNFIKFLEELDFIDKQWKKIGFEKWIFIEKWKWLFDEKDEWGWSYEIMDILKEKWKVKLKSLAGTELVDFENFLKIFKKDKFKRIKKINTFDEIINNKLNDNNWKNVKIENGELIQKEVEYNGEKKDRKIEILTWLETDKIVKINEISGDRVKAQFWNIKTLNKKEKKNKKYKEKDDIYELKLWDEVDISLNELNKYIEDFELYPDWKLGQKTIAKEAPKDLQNDIKGHLSTRLFNRYSISELIAGWKLMISGIEEYMKKWNDIHAAKFALWLGKILPEEIRADLKIKVEREEAEAMDKTIDALSKVDSPIATARIKRWLLNKDTPEYKKEAWLMFMLQKYGVLYAKELTEFQGKFLWYEAFWWRIWDALYNEEKEKAKRNNVPFSEEKLMHMLLKKQCKWLLKPERRSRLHKDYEGKWKTWVKEEFEKWYEDASKKRNATEMVEWWMWEAFWGTIPNAIWWFKKTVERWDSPEVMSEWFFSLMYSGVLWEQDENLLVKLKDLWDWDGLPIIMIRFASNKWDIDFFNNVVLELSKRISEVNSEKFPNIYKDAKEIYNEVLSWKGTEKERLEKTQNFWKKYASVLSRALYFQDIWASDTSKTDKIILLEKDKNSVFKKYYEMVRVFTWISWAFNKDLMDDESGEHWLAGLNHNEIIKRYFILDSSRNIVSKNISVVEKLWKKIAEDINFVREKNMEINWWDDEINKRKYLRLVFRDIFAWFRALQSEPLFIKKYVEWEPFRSDMQKWWVSVDTIHKFLNYSSWEILAWARWSDEIIDEIINNILSWNVQTTIKNNPLFETIDEIKEEIDESIKK